MKRRITILVFLLALAVSSIAVQVVTRSPTPCPVGLRPETSDKLELGMIEKDVAAILGGPAGDYRTQKDIGYLCAFSGPVVPRTAHHTKSEWLTDQYAIEVWFGEDGKALSIRSGVGLRSPTWPDRLLDKLQRLGPW
jgi:hypothetical protein